jgi:hypothetical protein
MQTVRLIFSCGMAIGCMGATVGCGGQPETGTQAQISAAESQRQKLGITEAMKKGAYGKGAMGAVPSVKTAPNTK